MDDTLMTVIWGLCGVVVLLWLMGKVNAAAEAAKKPIEPVPVTIDTTEPGVYLIQCGHRKIEVIKHIREATNLGLKESKALVESAPCKIGVALTPSQVEQLAVSLRKAGAQVHVTAS